MKERPILFSGPMVRAILSGAKTQTRRIFKGTTEHKGRYNPEYVRVHQHAEGWAQICPYGKPGDRLWVKETFSAHGALGADGRIVYRADVPGEREPHGLHWKPSIFMPRVASRITLEIESVRVERLQDISADDCLAEGITADQAQLGSDASWRAAYCRLWESINGAGSWKLNPYVWAITFRRL